MRSGSLNRSADMDDDKDQGGDKDHQNDLSNDGCPGAVFMKRVEFHSRNFQQRTRK